MHYTDFDIWVDNELDLEYPVRANCSLAGEYRGTFFLDKTISFECLQRLENRNTDEKYLRSFGTKLFNALFKDEIGDCFHQSLGAIHSSENRGIRLRLRIQPPELAIIPWELLYYLPEESFLGTLVEITVVRYLEIKKGYRDLKLPLPIQFLVVSPSYTGDDFLDSETELNNLKNILAGLENVIQVHYLSGKVTYNIFSRHLLENSYHIIHFIGHGYFEDDTGGLKLHGEEQKLDWVNERRMASLFRNCPKLKLLVLNSCESATASANQPFIGLAPRLAKIGIPAIIAMQFTIYDDVAIAFAEVFYRSLFKGTEKGLVDIAVNRARNNLYGNYPGERDVATPVLFLRAEDSRIFYTDPENFREAIPFTRSQYDTVKNTLEIVNQNVTAREQQFHNSRDNTDAQKLFEEVNEQKRLLRSIRLRNSILAGTAGVAFLLFFFSCIGILDFFTLDTKMASWTAWAGDHFLEKKLDDRLCQIVVQKHDEDKLGKPFGLDWRQFHAHLVDRLSEAGAEVIVFDLTFENPSPFDEAFASSIVKAEKKGTRVIVGVASKDGTSPKILETIEKSVSGYAVVCIGEKLGRAMVAPLVLENFDNENRIPSLSLKVYLELQKSILTEVDHSNNQLVLYTAQGKHSERLDFYSFDFVPKQNPKCNIMSLGDIVSEILIDIVPLSLLRSSTHRYGYHQVFAEMDGDKMARFKNGVVFIGFEEGDLKTKVYQGLAGEIYTGMELHIQALNSMMQGRIVQPLNRVYTFLCIFILAVIGALCHLLRRNRHPLFIRSVLTVTTCVYLVWSLLAYIFFMVLINALYGIAALFAAYFTAKKIEKRWYA